MEQWSGFISEIRPGYIENIHDSVKIGQQNGLWTMMNFLGSPVCPCGP